MVTEESLLTKLELLLTGLIALQLLGLYLVITLPIYIYRWVIAHLVAPFFRPDIGNIIGGLSLPLALEFYQKKKLKRDPSKPFQFKSSVVVKFAIDGIVPFDELLEAFRNRVLNKLSNNGGDLLYPELQQYPSTWMGFMFWKKDRKFNFHDHFHFHTTGKTGDSNMNSDQYVNGLMEQLVNKQFPFQRSPWEMHIIHNSQIGDLSEKSGNDMTVMLFCVHHSIADGYSLVNLLAKDFTNTPPSNFQYLAPTPKIALKAEKSERIIRHPIWDAITTGFRLSFQIISDLGYVLWIRRFQERTPWHVKPKEKRDQTLLLHRSQQIPMHIAKDVKNKFGVTFTSLLLSIFAKGISESFRKSERVKPEKFTVLVVQPLPNHPIELRNHATAVYVGISSDPELPPKQRLQLVDSSLKEQKSLFMRPIIASSLLNMFSFQLASVANLFIGRNPTFATSFSNFPLQITNLAFNGRKVVDMDFTCGTLQGVSGVAFVISSYDGNIRLGATAESGIMSRSELDELIHTIREELYVLYNQTFQQDENTKQEHIVTIVQESE